MSPTLGIPPEYHDRVLDKRAKSSDADAKRWWLLCRRLHLSKKFETEDGKFDSDALAKALSEVMARDRGNEDVPDLYPYVELHCLRADREQERRLARVQIQKMTSQEMEVELKQQLCDFRTTLDKYRFSCDNLIHAREFPIWAQMVANAGDLAQGHYKHQKDQEDYLKSLRRLVVDLGWAISECDSIQDYITVNNLLFWTTRGGLNLIPKNVGIGSLESDDDRYVGTISLVSAAERFHMNYIVCILVVESKAKTLSPGLPQLEQDIPSEDLDKLLKDRLEIVDTAITSTRKIQLFQKPPSYLTADGKVDFVSFAMVIAEGMAIDRGTQYPFSSLNMILNFEGACFVETMSPTQRLERKLNRSCLQYEGGSMIFDRQESEIMQRLTGDGWIKSIMDRAKIESADLLSPKAVQKMTENLALKIGGQLKEGPRIVDKKPKDGEVHIRLTEVRPFIIDLSGFMESWKDVQTYLCVSLYLFWATADAWWSLPTGDTKQEARNTAEKFLRNYLALVLIGEVKQKAQRLEQSKPDISKPEQSSTNSTGEAKSKPEQSKPDDQSSTNATGAAESKPEQTGKDKPVMYNIPPKPVPSTPETSKCCVIL
ncbi:hypothetical protein QBC32DRAFT_375678 [Pseudoneurospora amorphoporcata]|uniref:Uncharacterized protein n=1 Tax=Pseudoneurospora amorphoporcata TaxID=241081 RepID=A0AAN6P3A6_9PEZI|nr:hypothetical protein QBC32DRAFT_375678 [Pseudoneurospora amorphoporcata]